jgi:hypothetical protein
MQAQWDAFLANLRHGMRTDEVQELIPVGATVEKLAGPVEEWHITRGSAVSLITGDKLVLEFDNDKLFHGYFEVWEKLRALELPRSSKVGE